MPSFFSIVTLHSMLRGDCYKIEKLSMKLYTLGDQNQPSLKSPIANQYWVTSKVTKCKISSNFVAFSERYFKNWLLRILCCEVGWAIKWGLILITKGMKYHAVDCGIYNFTTICSQHTVTVKLRKKIVNNILAKLWNQCNDNFEPATL